MSKFMSYILLVLLSISSAQVCAGGNQEKALKKVESQVELLRKAMIDADEKQLNALTNKGLSYGHSSGRVEGRADFVKNIINGKSDFVVMSFDDQTVSVVKDIAIVRHLLVAETNDSGKPGKVKIGVMLVWKKFGKNWELLARQAYKLK